MTATNSISPDAVRAMFASALSSMYRREVPQYGTLLKLVSDINHKKHQQIEPRIEVERHGAIRLGTPEELSMMRRLFSVMGMHPVGYYDLTVASLPVHATCFRPLTQEALAYNPFRVFTSLLRLELIEDEDLRSKASEILSKRCIFTPRCVELIEQFELQGSFSEAIAEEFIKEALETFRWHKTSTVDLKTYKALRKAHPLISDVVCFKGPHINHLTPRVLDIETAQIEMLRYGLQAKDAIEGPPPRLCPILLRQTSFLAIDEAIAFSEGEETGGSHKARFGKIEQRGMALTPKGRQLYDDLINEWRETVSKLTEVESKEKHLAKIFERFPDNMETLRTEKLAYFAYKPVQSATKTPEADIDALVSSGAVVVEPITYEDFLPVSAAGIFHSNLGGDGGMRHTVGADKGSFEKNLGCAVKKEFDLYSEMQEASIRECFVTS
ncbi:hypothetical protein FVEN_g4554 [Fusarium venenatum]|uniref:2-oxoadipate dioxygenase/decarboxylase n=1 Tax=Fusarium venenatum TaxID=56646 RepID=A0A2L2TYI7_9HYPO|nr:uncharacterized protein FVRRES_02547 [Fusarium venenatum]KAG8357766.1 hypothetical protein FVEN_g4554 [Fusarium venenatum]KAH7004356.1 hypothetical protein EDB82DRAFT_486598 [Fusarium venenatum]CEI66035.1 unnamed protein product [Fusarium venenatum]